MIIYINNIYSTVMPDSRDEIAALRKFLSIKHPDLYMIQKARPNLRNWNGVICYLTSKNQFLTGLIPTILEEFKDVQLIDERKNPYPIKDITYDLNDYELHDEQVSAVEFFIENKVKNIRFTRGIIDGATNLGKDGIIAALHKRLQGKSLLLLHNKNLYNKGIEFFSRNLNSNVGYISEKGTNLQDFTVGMYKTTLNRYPDIYKEIHQFDNLIVDECFGGDVEILTNKGFVCFKDLKPECKIAQVDNFLNHNFTENFEIIHQKDRETVTLSLGTNKIICTAKHEFLLEGLGIKVTTDNLIKYRNFYIPRNGRLDNKDIVLADYTDIYRTLLLGIKQQRKELNRPIKRRFEDDYVIYTFNYPHMYEDILPTIRNYTTIEYDIANYTFKVKKKCKIDKEIDLSTISTDIAYDILNFCKTCNLLKINQYVRLPVNAQFITIVSYASFITEHRLQYGTTSLGRFYLRLQTYNPKVIKPDTISVQCNLWKEDVYCVRVPYGNIVIRSKRDTLVVGNCHRSSGKEYSTLIKSIPAYNRIFLSGTPLASDNVYKNIDVMGLSGNKVVSISNQKLIEKSISQKPIIHLYSIFDCRGSSYDDEYKNLQSSKSRLNIMASYVRNNKKVLIAVKDIQHGEALERDLVVLEKTYKRVKFIHANHPERFSAIDDFEDGKIDCLITTLILKEGVNLPSIRVLILALGGKSEITVKQLIGRALRNDQIHKDVVIVDFYDYGKHLKKHSENRLKIYGKEEFEVIHQN